MATWVNSPWDTPASWRWGLTPPPSSRSMPVCRRCCACRSPLRGELPPPALTGYLIGLLTFKTVGDYLAIITLGFNMIIVNAIQNMEFLGGPRGLTGIPKGTNFLTIALCVVLTYAILRNLVNSSYGRMWIAIREKQHRQPAHGG